jgi:WD40 repeat protein
VSPALVLDHSDAFEAPFVWEACFDSSGERVLSVARDFHSAHLWDARTGEHRLAFPHDAAVEGARFAPGGERVLTFGQDRTARLWNSRTGERVGPALEHESPVLVASFNSDGALVVTGCEDGTAHVWRVSDGSKVAEIEHAGPVVTVSFTPDGSCFLVAGGVSARRYAVAAGARGSAPTDERSRPAAPTASCGSGTRARARRSRPSSSIRPARSTRTSRRR